MSMILTPRGWKPINESAVTINEQTAGAAGHNKSYSLSDENGYKHSNKLDSAVSHAEKKGYTINHGNSHHQVGSGPVKKGAHKSPDVTLHAHGDDVESYTVHHKGAAANDSKMHHQVLHKQHKELYNTNSHV